jgi:hypothetical protein
MRKQGNARNTWLLSLLTAAVITACGADEGPVAPTVTDTELAGILLAAIQDEYHAEAVYEGVLDDFGQVLPFANIVNAEIRHSTAIARLYENRGWDVPLNEWTPVDVPHFRTIVEACAVGVEGELANIALYDDLLAGVTLPLDVLQVFSTNRAASLEHHLPAFERCSEGVWTSG